MNARDARALIVGAGGLGSPAGIVLARAGVGAITFADDDAVAAGNLHRQVLHRAADAGRAKAESAAEAVRRLAPGVVAHARCSRITAENALSTVSDFDVVLDGSDNFATKFLVNDACVLAGVPFVHAAAIRWMGQLLAVRPGAPCYRCLFEEIPPPAAGQSCAEAGICGPVVGVVGALQAEAALALLGIGNGNANGNANESTLVVYDGLAGSTRQIHFRHNRACRACAHAALDPRQYEVAAC